MATKFKTQKCKGCGRHVVFAKDENGNTQILDPSAPVFEVMSAETITARRQREKTSVVGHPTAFMVSHFSTCSHANEFSASKKGRQG